MSVGTLTTLPTGRHGPSPGLEQTVGRDANSDMSDLLPPGRRFGDNNSDMSDLLFVSRRFGDNNSDMSDLLFVSRRFAPERDAAAGEDPVAGGNG